MESHESIIVGILKELKCFGQENMITPEHLLSKCAEKGLTDGDAIEAAIISLVDQDIIEYEMDDNLQTSELWLL